MFAPLADSWERDISPFKPVPNTWKDIAWKRAITHVTAMNREEQTKQSAWCYSHSNG